jgi:hypothetical protein
VRVKCFPGGANVMITILSDFIDNQNEPFLA